MSLPTNYQDDVLDTSVNEVRRYNVKKFSDDSVVQGDVYLEEITEYSQEGSAFGANAINGINTEINQLNSNLTANSNSFIFDYQDGKYGFNTSEERGADTFHPFSNIKMTFDLTLTAYGSIGNTTCTIIPNLGWKTIKAVGNNGRWYCDDSNSYSTTWVDNTPSQFDVSNFQYIRIRLSGYGPGTGQQFGNYKRTFTLE